MTGEMQEQKTDLICMTFSLASVSMATACHMFTC